MYKLKQIPEDFIVKEINEVILDNSGQYSYFILKKTNYNTIRAIEQISERANILAKNIGFAGSKDKNAVTEQLISVFQGRKDIENLSIRDIELKYLGKGKEKVFLGGLKGNLFEITIRNLDEDDTSKIKEKDIMMPNYFGEQRFSKNNKDIGKSIIKQDFKSASDLITSSDSDYSFKMNSHLEKSPNDYVVALKFIPLKMLKLYIHSYQSFLFNKTIDECIKNNISLEDKKIPLVGFGTEIGDEKIDQVLKNILKEENLVPRDFIIRQIPDLSTEGDRRDALISIDDFKIIKEEKDELNKGKKKLVVSFSLPKGAYATVLIDYLFKQ